MSNHYFIVNNLDHEYYCRWVTTPYLNITIALIFFAFPHQFYETCKAERCCFANFQTLFIGLV